MRASTAFDAVAHVLWAWPEATEGDAARAIAIAVDWSLEDYPDTPDAVVPMRAREQAAIARAVSVHGFVRCECGARSARFVRSALASIPSCYLCDEPEDEEEPFARLLPSVRFAYGILQASVCAPF